MDPFEKHKAKLTDAQKRALLKNPVLKDALGTMAMTEMTKLGYRWIMEKAGRRIVVEHEPDGMSVQFLEDGQVVEPFW
jgi:hypothetical protein